MNRRAVLQRLALLPLLGPVIAKIATSPPAPPVWRFVAMHMREADWAHALYGKATIVNRLTGERASVTIANVMRVGVPRGRDEQRLATWLHQLMEQEYGPIAGWPLRIKIWPGR